MHEHYFQKTQNTHADIKCLYIMAVVTSLQHEGLLRTPSLGYSVQNMSHNHLCLWCMAFYLLPFLVCTSCRLPLRNPPYLPLHPPMRSFPSLMPPREVYPPNQKAPVVDMVNPLACIRCPPYVPVRSVGEDRVVGPWHLGADLRRSLLMDLQVHHS